MFKKENLIKYISIGAVGFIFLAVFTIYNISSNKASEEVISLNEIIHDDVNENVDKNLVEFQVYDEDVQKENIFVEIKGEVENPDVYEIEVGSIVKDLIVLSGGLTEIGDVSNINQAREIQSGECIIIYSKDEIEKMKLYDESLVNLSDSPNNFNNQTGNKSNNDGIININSASVEELKTLNGIGDTLAESIISYREDNGSFKTIDELLNVSRIGVKTLEKFKDKIKV